MFDQPCCDSDPQTKMVNALRHTNSSIKAYHRKMSSLEILEVFICTYSSTGSGLKLELFAYCLAN